MRIGAAGWVAWVAGVVCLCGGTSARAAGAGDVLSSLRERAAIAPEPATGLGGALGARTKGVALTPNGDILVNKQQADGRWMIALDSGSGILTGNVLTDAGDAVFLWCDVVGAWGEQSDIEASGLIFDCQSTEDGQTWFIVAQGVEVPASLFLP